MIERLEGRACPTVALYPADLLPLEDSRSAWTLAVGDFDRDGTQDLVVGSTFVFSTQNTGSLQILFGDGTEGYGAPQLLLPDAPLDVYAEDLDHDDDLDLIVVGYRAEWHMPEEFNRVRVYWNAGTGQFLEHWEMPLYGPSSSSVLGDVNHDGWADLVVVQHGNTPFGESDQPFLLLGTSAGVFAEPQALSLGTRFGPSLIQDLNADGNADLVVSSVYRHYPEFAGPTTVYLGLGDGSFTSWASYTLGSGNHELASGDLNGDGRPDLIVVNSAYQSGPGITDETMPLTFQSIAVLLGLGDGTFADPEYYRTGRNPKLPHIADLNSDGYPDVAVVADGQLQAWEGHGNGQFSPVQNTSLPFDATDLVIEDLDADQHPDVALTGSNSGGAVSFLFSRPQLRDVRLLDGQDGRPLQALSLDSQNPYFQGATLVDGSFELAAQPETQVVSAVLEVLDGPQVIASATGILASADPGATSHTASFRIKNSSIQQTNFSTDRNVELRLRITLSDGQTIMRTWGSVPVLVRFTGSNRFGKPGAVPGGSEWVRPSARSFMEQFPNLLWGAASNMNDGSLNSGRSGLQIDATFKGFNGKSAASAQQLLRLLNNPAVGSRIEFLDLQFTLKSKFYAAIKDVQLADGRMAVSVLRMANIPKTYFTISLTPAS